jgi:hypothetical protein
MLDRPAQAVKDLRAHAKGPDRLPRRQDQRDWRPDAAGTRPPGWGLAGADRFDKQAEVYKKAATTCK